jgi:hypothetical protein
MKRKETMGIAGKRAPLETALSKIPGGWFAAFPILAKTARKDDNSEAARLLQAWDELGGKKDVTPEEIAEAAGMTPGHMVGVIAEAAYDNSIHVARLIEALNLEDIMNRAVKEAKKPDGYKDREKILQSAGLYPTPSGATFINNPTAIAGASLRAAIPGDADGLTGIEEDTIEFTTLVRGGGEERVLSPSRMIDAPSPAASVPPEEGQHGPGA